VYRLLKAHDLIASPAFVVVKAADAFAEPTTAPNQLWQTDFTYLKVIGWGVLRTHLSTILDDFSRFIVAWKLCTTMRAGDVTDTLELAPPAATPRRSCTGPGCSATTARPTSPAIWRAGSRARASPTSAARRTTRRPRARSSAGIRP
jgi:transposase InsO family protein